MCYHNENLNFLHHLHLCFSGMSSPGSAHHHALGPGLHDLHEGAVVKEAALPGTLWCFWRRKQKMLHAHGNWRRTSPSLMFSPQQRLVRGACRTARHFPTARTICTVGSDHDGWLYKEACSALFLPAHPDKHAQSTRVTVQLNLATHGWADTLVAPTPRTPPLHPPPPLLFP